MSRRALLDLTHEQLAEWLQSHGQPAYRVKQIWRGVFRDLAADYKAITTLPLPLRELLSERLPLDPLVAAASTEDKAQRVRKLLFRLGDGETIEAVLMRYERRRTACLSSQVGCPVGCAFCATGQDGYVRDLSTGEIVAQALSFARSLKANGERLTNIVYMGMGEPLLNYDATLQSIRILNDPRGFGLGVRAFTVSTAGVVPRIRRLAREGLEIGLAVSLHTVDDALRNTLVPLNRTHAVAELLAACREYVDVTHRRITFEVALLRGVNDSQQQAQDLAIRLDGLLCHVNLIPGNPCTGTELQPSSRTVIDRFAEILQGAGVPTTVRVARGLEIEAGCGQLRRRHL